MRIPHLDPYELEVVYPQDPTFASSTTLVDLDVVAVHGLNLDGNLIHHRDTWTKNGQIWLKDILPYFLHQRCRVMLFAYSVGRAIVEDDALLSRHAGRLLAALQEKRQNAPRRPLLLVGQDFGGLVVKEALMTASVDSANGFRALFEATRMIVFFNTPHRSPASAVRNMAQAALHVPAENVIKKLEDECGRFAQRLQPFEQYRRLYTRRSIFNLHATIPLPNRTLLVDRRGSTLHLPDYWEKQYPINGDHSSICKFDSMKDLGCQIVVRTIAMHVSKGFEVPNI